MLHGMEAFVGGIGFVIATPRVWGYALVPVGMLLLLSCGLIGLGMWGSHYLSSWIIGPDPDSWGQIGYWGMMSALVVVVFFAAVLLALSLAQPLSGFALESIAHAQEIALTRAAAPKASFFAALVSTTSAVFVALLVGGSLLAVLFLVSLFFPPAAVVTVPLKVLVCGWMLAWDFIDYPLAIRGAGGPGGGRIPGLLASHPQQTRASASESPLSRSPVEQRPLAPVCACVSVCNGDCYRKFS